MCLTTTVAGTASDEGSHVVPSNCSDHHRRRRDHRRYRAARAQVRALGRRIPGGDGQGRVSSIVETGSNEDAGRTRVTVRYRTRVWIAVVEPDVPWSKGILPRGATREAFFPLNVVEQQPPTGNVKMSVRFYPFAGQVDQAAGIAFGIQPDGSYVCVRANALEDNILWARIVRGKRTILDTIRDTPTPTRTWHTLTITLRGREMNVELDGESRFHKTLDDVPHGRVGLWSKADSQVLFDDFRVEPIP